MNSDLTYKCLVIKGLKKNIYILVENFVLELAALELGQSDFAVELHQLEPGWKENFYSQVIKTDIFSLLKLIKPLITLLFQKLAYRL